MSQNTLHIVGIGGTLRDQSTSRFALEHALRAARCPEGGTSCRSLCRTA